MKKLTTLIALSAVMAITGCDKKTEQTEQVANQPTLEEQAEMLSESVETTDVTAENVFVRASFPGQSISAAFFTLKNSSDKDIEVISITSNLSDATEFHTMETKNSKMIMRKLDNVVVPANGELALTAGAKHVMLLNLEEPLETGKEVVLNLGFSDGTSLEVKGVAADLNAQKESSVEDSEHQNHGEKKGNMNEEMDHGDMDHGDMDHGDMDHGDMDSSES